MNVQIANVLIWSAQRTPPMSLRQDSISVSSKKNTTTNGDTFAMMILIKQMLMLHVRKLMDPISELPLSFQNRCVKD